MVLIVAAPSNSSVMVLPLQVTVFPVLMKMNIQPMLFCLCECENAVFSHLLGILLTRRKEEKVSFDTTPPAALSEGGFNGSPSREKFY
jgi:hypothetical protein